MRHMDEENSQLRAECQELWDKLNTPASVGRTSRPSSYMAAVSADGDAGIQSTDEQTSD